MPYTLALQSWGTAGLDVTRTAPTERFGSLSTHGGDLVGLIVENQAGNAVTVSIAASFECSRGSMHDVEVEIPDGGVAGPILLNQSADGVRFAGSVTVDFGADYADLLVAAVRIGALYGIGDLGVTAAPAVGASPGTIPLYGKDDEPTLTVCDADGMRVDLPSGEVQLVVENGSGTDETIYLHATRACNMGFLEPEAVVVPAASVRFTKTLGPRFTGDRLYVTYADASGLAMAAVSQESFRA